MITPQDMESKGFHLLDDGCHYQFWKKPYLSEFAEYADKGQAAIRRKADGHVWFFPEGETSIRIADQLADHNNALWNTPNHPYASIYGEHGIDWLGHKWTVADPGSL